MAENERDCVLSLKIILCGCSGVGKSSIIRRYVNEGYDKRYLVTVGWQSSRLILHTNYGKILFELWDQDGNAMSSHPMVYQSIVQGCHGCILMFDLTSRLTYKDIPNWYRRFTQAVVDSVPIALCGNKSDDYMNRKVQPAHIKYHRKKNLPYYEISVKRCWNIYKPLLYFLKKVTGEDNIRFVEFNPVDYSPLMSVDWRSSLLWLRFAESTDEGATCPLPCNEEGILLVF